MALKFRCPNCNKITVVVKEKIGEVARCPRCKAGISVPVNAVEAGYRLLDFVGQSAVVVGGLLLFLYYTSELPESYLYVSIALFVCGILMIVGDQINKRIEAVRITSEQQSSPSQEQRNSNKAKSIPEQIEELAKLKERGILSEAEFEEKKKDLLSRM